MVKIIDPIKTAPDEKLRKSREYLSSSPNHPPRLDYLNRQST
jgi:hypothetical protein